MGEVYDNIKSGKSLNVPDNWLKISTIDMHTEGEPLRVIVDGFPELIGNNVLSIRKYVKEHYDHLRTALMFEPRGHADMYGCILTPPFSDEADFGIIFMHNEGYSTMCGHATIAITKLAVEMGWIQKTRPVTKLKIDAPCGLIIAYAGIENNTVTDVSFDNVPSFVMGLSREVAVPGLGTINYDLAYGGAFYAFVDADNLGIDMTAENYQYLIKTGMDIKKAVMQSDNDIRHPFEEDLSFLYGTIFTGKAHSDHAGSRNVCIFADGEVDRSPTGSGVSARMAIHYKKGDLKIGDSMVIESILGTTFTGSVKDVTSFGEFDAVIPNVKGTARITGKHEFLIDPDDPLKNGFILK